jgi:NAD+ synthase
MSLKKDIQIDCAETVNSICAFIKEQVKVFNKSGIILGLSGGIDSACVAALSVRAIGKEKILGLIMPERDSAKETIHDAELVAARFGIETKLIDITPILEKFDIYSHVLRDKFTPGILSEKLVQIGYKLFPATRSPFVSGLRGSKYEWLRRIEAYYRIKCRIRMVNLYYYGEQKNYLVVGTSNKTEDLVGFFVKYGDGAADIMPIAHLFKTQVRSLSRYLEVPEPIIEKKPSPDLLPGITDELALKISYDDLDIILSGLEKSKEDKEIASELGINVSKIKYVKMLVNLSESMRILPVKPDF